MPSVKQYINSLVEWEIYYTPGAPVGDVRLLVMPELTEGDYVYETCGKGILEWARGLLNRFLALVVD